MLSVLSRVLAEAHHAAVVLVAPSLVQHAGVDDVAHWHVQVIGTQVLQQLQRLVSRRLHMQYKTCIIYKQTPHKHLVQPVRDILCLQ